MLKLPEVLTDDTPLLAMDLIAVLDAIMIGNIEVFGVFRTRRRGVAAESFHTGARAL